MLVRTPGATDEDQYRVEETARWFAMGFWGINYTDHVSFTSVPETECMLLDEY